MEKRLPKSPLLPPKSPVLYESCKSGCARSLIHFFGFRQNSSKKTISSKKHAKKQTTDKEKKMKKLINLLTDDEKPQESDERIDCKNMLVNQRKSVIKCIVEEDMPKVQSVQSESVGVSAKKHQSSGKKYMYFYL